LWRGRRWAYIDHVGRALYADIVDQHAAEAAFLWRLRDGAAVAPHYDAAALAGLDDRIEAHLDGIRLAGAAGLRACEAALDPDEPGTVFTLLTLSVEQGAAPRVEAALAIADAAPAAARGAVSALGWLPFEKARPAIGPLLSPSAPAARRRLGIAASAAHREDPGDALSYAVHDGDLRLRARALRAAGELGRADLLPGVRAELGAADAACRFWAAWSAALLGEPAAIEALWAIADGDGPFSERAAAVAVRRLDVLEARARLEGLGAWPDRARSAVIGAGALGDPGLAPWLLARMATPALARLAGEAFATITGATIEGPLEGRAPEGFHAGPTENAEDDDVSMDPDGQLRWPATKALERWWIERESAFRRGARYLGGAVLTAEVAERDLAHGTQRRRAGAALELALQRPGKLAEVRRRAG
jgi:uncharacterized protein (TIGR02270 family)